MTARNRRAYEHGLAVRAAVRDILASHTQLVPPLTARQINALLPPTLRWLPGSKIMRS